MTRLVEERRFERPLGEQELQASTARSAGRTMGVLLLLQMVGGALANFVLIAPVFAAPGFLVNAAVHPLRVSLTVVVGLGTGALSIGIAVAALPVFRRYSQSMAFWLLALAIASFSLTAVENVTVWSMLPLSQAYAAASGADGDLFQSLRVVVASVRNGAHYVSLVVGGSMIFVLYGVLYRFVLIPRALAAFGLVATLLQLTAVTLPLFGYPVVLLMILPLGLSQLALATWLTARSFDEPPHQVPPG